MRWSWAGDTKMLKFPNEPPHFCDNPRCFVLLLRKMASDTDTPALPIVCRPTVRRWEEREMVLLAIIVNWTQSQQWERSVSSLEFSKTSELWVWEGPKKVYKWRPLVWPRQFSLPRIVLYGLLPCNIFRGNSWQWSGMGPDHKKCWECFETSSHLVRKSV